MVCALLTSAGAEDQFRGISSFLIILGAAFPAPEMRRGDGEGASRCLCNWTPVSGSCQCPSGPGRLLGPLSGTCDFCRRLRGASCSWSRRSSLPGAAAPLWGGEPRSPLPGSADGPAHRRLVPLRHSRCVSATLQLKEVTPAPFAGVHLIRRRPTLPCCADGGGCLHAASSLCPASTSCSGRPRDASAEPARADTHPGPGWPVPPCRPPRAAAVNAAFHQ